ncbi:hypothetical protein EOL70_06720 [Leucothrix sargassi]|nr:hypothetical protein EOL70_06720 [Leucothrix sargassi]
MKANIIKLTSAIGLLLCATTPAFADAPKVPSDKPYFALADNLDEPNGYGFCLDTAGRGKTDLLQTHTCKPASKDKEGKPTPNDTQFWYDAENKRLESVAYPGMCMQVLMSPYANVFALLECGDQPRQKFVYSSENKMLKMDEDQTKCLSVVSETQKAGPWSSRALALTACEETEDSLKQWIYVSK